MNKAVSVYDQGVCVETFTFAEEELRQFVIYTYYSKEEQPLYVGASKDFYNAHYFNSQRLPFFDDVAYVGFFLLDNEADMKDARKYFIKAREPLHNQRKCKDTPLLPGLDPSCDDFVVSANEMEQRWREWLGIETTLQDLQIDKKSENSENY